MIWGNEPPVLQSPDPLPYTKPTGPRELPSNLLSSALPRVYDGCGPTPSVSARTGCSTSKPAIQTPASSSTVTSLRTPIGLSNTRSGVVNCCERVVISTKSVAQAMATTLTQRQRGVGGRPFGNSSRMSSSGKISSRQP